MDGSCGGGGCWRSFHHLLTAGAGRLLLLLLLLQVTASLRRVGQGQRHLVLLRKLLRVSCGVAKSNQLKYISRWMSLWVVQLNASIQRVETDQLKYRKTYHLRYDDVMRLTVDVQHEIDTDFDCPKRLTGLIRSSRTSWMRESSTSSLMTATS